MFALRAAGLIGAAAVLAGCSSGSGNPASSPSTGDNASDSASVSSPTPTADAAKQQYLDAVNQLCDDLLPKVIKATHGGSIDIPAAQYLKDWPGHKKVLDAFDTDLAGVPVPTAAQGASRAMAGYIRYADQLDAARLAAAQQGQAAYHQEVKAEEAAPTDPSVEARTRAGFHQSCDAR
jgi:hypothetical protein